MHHAIVLNGSRRSTKPGVRRRAEFYYQQFDALRCLRQEVRRELLAEAGSTRPGNCYARFRSSARSGPLC